MAVRAESPRRNANHETGITPDVDGSNDQFSDDDERGGRGMTV